MQLRPYIPHLLISTAKEQLSIKYIYEVKYIKCMVGLEERSPLYLKNGDILARMEILYMSDFKPKLTYSILLYNNINNKINITYTTIINHFPTNLWNSYC